MKKYLLYIIPLLLVIKSAVFSANVIIAIAPFNAGENLRFKDYYRSELPAYFIDGLSKYHTLKVIDRINIDKVLNEINLSQTGLIDETKAPEIGKMLSADYILVGAVNRFGIHTTITIQSINVETGSVDFSIKETKVVKSYRNIYELQESLLIKILSHFVPDNAIASQSIRFVYEDQEGYNKTLIDGVKLKSKDAYSILIKPSEIMYLYIFQIDGVGETHQLFPNNKLLTLQNPLKADNIYWIPDENENFHLGEIKGKEYIIAFATSFKINDFEEKKNIQLKSNKIIATTSRYKKENSQDQTKGYDLDNLIIQLEKRGTFVYKKWYYNE